MPRGSSTWSGAMQVWPQLSSLPCTMRGMARTRSTPTSSRQGDLPPSSSVVGTSCAAAANATRRPTAGEPVNSRWSQRRPEKAAATSASPVTTSNSSASKRSASSAARQPAVCGVASLGLSMARLPAASAATAGPRARFTG